LRRKNIRRILDREDVTPSDVSHWIVELHEEFDERDLTPLEAVRRATKAKGHCWTVTHVRSGLMWSVCLERDEVVEIAETHTC
jgi:hypothetical protein